MCALQSGGFARSSTQINPGLVDPRLLAARYDDILQGAGQGMQLVGNFGRLQDLALARDEERRTREATIAARNAKSRLLSEQAGSELELLPLATDMRRGTLQLAANQNAGELSRVPMEDQLRGLKLANNLGQAQFDQLTMDERQALARGEMDLKKTEQELAKKKQELQSIQTETEKIVAEETAAFLKANPEATQQDLEAKLLNSKRLLNHAKEYQKFEQDNPKFFISGLQAELAKNLASKAESDAVVRSGGIRPSARHGTQPGDEFAKGAVRNLVDADRALGFGSLEAVQAFQRTPEGQRIISAILTTPAMGRYSARAKDQQAIESFRKVLSGAQEPAPKSSSFSPPRDRVAPVGLNDLITGAGSKPKAAAQPPQAAINYLRANPGLAAQFEAKYGIPAAQFLQ